jgi:hypothetical protein
LKGFLTPLCLGKILKISALEGESSRRLDDKNTFGKKGVFINMRVPPPRNGYAPPGSLKNPGQHRSIMGLRRKGRGYMGRPTAGRLGNLITSFD